MTKGTFIKYKLNGMLHTISRDITRATFTLAKLVEKEKVSVIHNLLDEIKKNYTYREKIQAILQIVNQMSDEELEVTNKSLRAVEELFPPEKE